MLPTMPVMALALRPVGALASTRNVNVTAAAIVPVTDAACVEPLMPVAATLTSPADTDSEGVLYSGADAEGTYAKMAGLKAIDTCHDVSTLVPVKKSSGTVIVSPA